MERPPENPIEKYITTNHEGSTCYVYWKIIYEEITEEFLYENYDIKKAKINEPQSPMRNMSYVNPKPNIDPFKGSLSKQNPGESSYRNLHLAPNPEPGTSPTKKFLHEISCFDELDILSNTYLSRSKRVRRRTESSQEVSETHSILLRSSNVYAPVAICIKTKIPLYEESVKLLEQLIGILYNKSQQNIYEKEEQRKIYAFAELSTYILLLTHLPIPPPISEFAIYFSETAICFRESPLNCLPCEGDPSVAQLFSLLSIDYIVDIWNAFILEYKIIIYTSKPVYFFYIAKAMEQLLFPFTWAFSKGVTPILGVLEHINPYFLGILKSTINDPKLVHETLMRHGDSYIFIDINDPTATTFKIYNDKNFPYYHRSYSLKQALANLCKKYFISNTGEIYKIYSREREFADKVREIFLHETTYLLNGMESIFAEKHPKDCIEFVQEFLKKYKMTHSKAHPEELRFMQLLTGTQGFAYLFDELFLEFQGNYSRVLAMKKADQRENCKKVSLKLAISHNNVTSFLQIIKQISVNRKTERKLKTGNLEFDTISEASSESDICLKTRFDWLYEIQLMKKMDSQRQVQWKSLRFFDPSILEKGRNSGPIVLSSKGKSNENEETKSTFKNYDDIVMNIVEEKLQTKNTITGVPATIKERCLENLLPPKINHGPMFYGPTGFHAFLSEMLSNSDKVTFEQHLIEEFKDIFAYIKNAIAKKEAKNKEEEENKGSTVSDKSLFFNNLLNANTQTITDSVIQNSDDFDEDNSSASGKMEKELLTFSVSKSCQFFLYVAFYYTKYKQHIYEIVKVFFSHFIIEKKTYMEAYSALPPKCSLYSIFPMSRFKQLLKKLDFSLLRELLACNGELTYVIKDVYEMRSSLSHQKSNIDKKTPSVEKIKRILQRTNTALLERHKDKRKKQFIKSSESEVLGHLREISPPQSNILTVIKPSPFSNVCRFSPEIKPENLDEDMPKLPELNLSEKRIFVNNHRTSFVFENTNPVEIIEALLSDIILLLKEVKNERESMFYMASKLSRYKEIQYQACALRVFFIFSYL